jgi:hypothetical protein
MRTPADVLSLPVHIIVGHGCDDVYVVTTPDGYVERDTARVRDLDVPQGAYHVACTPPAAWGVLHCDNDREQKGHMMRTPGSDILWSLFAPGPVPERVALRVQDGGKPSRARPHLVPAGATARNTSYEFFGETLCQNGLGVVTVRGAETAEEVAAGGVTRVGGVPLYSSMRKHKRLWDLVSQRTQARRAVWLSELMNALGPGVYVSLACRTLRVHARRHGWGSPKCLPIAASTEPIYRQVAEEVTAETAEGNKAWEAHVAGLWETQHYDLRSRRRPVKPPTAACSFHEDVPEGTKPRDRDFSLAEAWGPTRTRARTAVERERRARYTP